MNTKIWRFIHNAIAHPLLAFGSTKWNERFHDWTAAKMTAGDPSRFQGHGSAEAWLEAMRKENMPRTDLVEEPKYDKEQIDYIEGLRRQVLDNIYVPTTQEAVAIEAYTAWERRHDHMQKASPYELAFYREVLQHAWPKGAGAHWLVASHYTSDGLSFEFDTAQHAEEFRGWLHSLFLYNTVRYAGTRAPLRQNVTVWFDHAMLEKHTNLNVPKSLLSENQ